MMTDVHQETRTFDAAALRKDFPLLQQTIKGKPLVYLDNAATTQKPASVIGAVNSYYRMDNANIHRGVHALSERATAAYEGTREKVRRFLHAGSVREIVFVRGTTEGINLVAQSYGRKSIRKGDEVLISGLEHHSNIVPWQMLCLEREAVLQVVPIDDNGEIIFEEYERLLSEKTRIVAVGHVSNALGTVNPVKAMVAAAHRRGIPVLIDGAQAVAHTKVDVKDLDADFYAFSGHKMFGPTGIGVLYGKEALLEDMPPYQGGGDMIKSVTFEKTVYNDLPHKFEAGTPNIAGTIGLGAAVDYLSSLDIRSVESHEKHLVMHMVDLLRSMDGIRLIGNARERLGVVSFVMENVHPHDIGTILDEEGIAIRTGHHCAQPVMERFGVPATARASFALYNVVEECDALLKGMRRVKEVFA